MDLGRRHSGPGASCCSGLEVRSPPQPEQSSVQSSRLGISYCRTNSTTAGASNRLSQWSGKRLSRRCRRSAIGVWSRSLISEAGLSGDGLCNDRAATAAGVTDSVACIQTAHWGHCEWWRRGVANRIEYESSTINRGQHMSGRRYVLVPPGWRYWSGTRSCRRTVLYTVQHGAQDRTDVALGHTSHCLFRSPLSACRHSGHSGQTRARRTVTHSET